MRIKGIKLHFLCDVKPPWSCQEKHIDIKLSWFSNVSFAFKIWNVKNYICHELTFIQVKTHASIKSENHTLSSFGHFD